jgi:hypothetical protein
MKSTSFALLAVSATAAMLFQTAVATADEAAMQPVAGQKLDSGLGDLPHYRYWTDKTGKNPMAHQVAGQKLDSGLGDLPHYRYWTDKTGKMPVRLEQVVAESTKR